MKKNLLKWAFTIATMVMLMLFSKTDIYRENHTPVMVDQMICLAVAVVGFTALIYFFILSYKIIRELRNK